MDQRGERKGKEEERKGRKDKLNTFSSRNGIDLGGFVATRREPLAIIAEFDAADNGLVLEIKGEINAEIRLNVRVVSDAPVLGFIWRRST